MSSLQKSENNNKITILIRCCDPRRLNQHNFNAMSKVIGVQPGEFYDLAAAGSIHFWKELIEKSENLAKDQINALCGQNSSNIFLSFHADCKGYKAYFNHIFQNIDALNNEEYKIIEKYIQLQDMKYVHNWFVSNYPKSELHIIYSAIYNNCNIFEISKISYNDVITEITDLKSVFHDLLYIIK